MNGYVRKFIGDWRYYTTIGVIALFLLRIWFVPDRVKANEEDIVEVREAIVELSGDIRILVAVHKEQMKQNTEEHRDFKDTQKRLIELHLRTVDGN